MKLRAEAMAMIVIAFAFTVACSYLWGYANGKADSQCYVIEGE